MKKTQNIDNSLQERRYHHPLAKTRQEKKKHTSDNTTQRKSRGNNMSQRAAPLKAKTLQKHTPSRGKREKQTTTKITHMEDQRTEARRLEKKNEKRLTGPRSYSTRKTTYKKRSRQDARRET